MSRLHRRRSKVDTEASDDDDVTAPRVAPTTPVPSASCTSHRTVAMTTPMIRLEPPGSGPSSTTTTSRLSVMRTTVTAVPCRDRSDPWPRGGGRSIGLVVMIVTTLLARRTVVVTGQTVAPTSAPTPFLSTTTPAPVVVSTTLAPAATPVATTAPAITPVATPVSTPVATPVVTPTVTTAVPSLSTGVTTTAPVAPTTSTSTPTAVPSLAVPVASESPSEIPSDVPTSGPPTSLAPSTGAPSDAPSAVPTALVATEPPSATPTTAPTATPSLAPTTSAPSVTPTTAATPARTTVSVASIRVPLPGVEELNAAGIAAFTDTTTQWFQIYYNGLPADSTSTRRRLAYGDGVPGISNMTTRVRFLSQSTDNSGTPVITTVQYGQDMSFVQDADADTSVEAESLALTPYQDEDANTALVEQLRLDNPSAFGDLRDPIPNPTIGNSTTPPVTDDDVDNGNAADSGLSTKIIIGIAVGGAVLLLLLGFLLMRSWGGDREEQDRHNATNNGKAQALNDNDVFSYEDTESRPPASFLMNPNDDVSTIQDPMLPLSHYSSQPQPPPNHSSLYHPAMSSKSGGSAPPSQHSMGEYGDQSVATVDYDYSKAYGGAGDTSVVSSVGGTLGDNTQPTSGGMEAGTLAARQALGASYDSDGRYNARDDAAAARDEVIVIDAPPGKLGVVIDTPDDGAPVVHAVKDSSVIAHLIQVGDKLIAVDEVDVRTMTAIKVSKLISRKSANPNRKLTVMRTLPPM